MSVVGRGFALDVDSQSAIVAFGLATINGAPEEIPIDLLQTTTIDNWYAVDYGCRKRRPVTPMEWRRIKALWRVWERSRVERERKEAAMRKQDAGFMPIVMPPLEAPCQVIRPRPRALRDRRTGLYVTNAPR